VRAAAEDDRVEGEFVVPVQPVQLPHGERKFLGAAPSPARATADDHFRERPPLGEDFDHVAHGGPGGAGDERHAPRRGAEAGRLRSGLK